MKARRSPAQGDVWLVGLDPTHGSEIRKTRPCVVVSPDEMNRHLATAIIVPLTTTLRSYPTRVKVIFHGKKGEAALDQIRSVDKNRLAKKLGRLSGATMTEIAAVLVEMFTRV